MPNVEILFFPLLVYSYILNLHFYLLLILCVLLHICVEIVNYLE